MLATSIVTPGASYIFTWPLLFAAIAMVYRAARLTTDAIRPAILALVAIAPGIAMLAPAFAASADGTIFSSYIAGIDRAH